MTKVLLIEDDKEIVKNLTEFLQSEGFSVNSAAGQSEAIEKIDGGNYDLALLDISLKEGNGFAVCSYLKKNTSTAVIFLTASGDEYSVVSGLDMGADDYISKPFRPRELISRIKSVLRRTGRVQSVIEVGGVSIDTTKGAASKHGKELFLTALEYRILLVFFNHKGMVLSREQLLEEIWDVVGEFVNDNTLTVYIKRLREKIEDNPANPTIIKTVRGLGYRVE